MKASLRINTPKVVHETIEGETVILNLDSGNYYSLEGLSGDIWSLLERDASAGEIIDWICRLYEGDKREMEDAISDFINNLLKEGLISSAPESSTKPDLEPRISARVSLSSNVARTSFKRPVLNKYEDMQDLLLLDPIHEVTEDAGWPIRKVD
jgi:hypothetical protein